MSLEVDSREANGKIVNSQIEEKVITSNAGSQLASDTKAESYPRDE